jgi:hypothetical protein
MSTAQAQQDTQAALAAVLSTGRLSQPVRAKAEKLSALLDTPTRISVFGLPGAGKTGVINLLAGATVVPEMLSLGTIQISYGPEESTHPTLEDGETLELDGLPDVMTMNGLTPALTRITAPLPALKKISLMELGPAETASAQAKAIAWAAKRTEIGIWCTQSFSELEDSLWQTAPVQLRSHSIALLTQCDQLGAERAAHVQNLQRRVAGEFTFVMGVSVKEAQAATGEGVVDKDLMRASGGMKLISTLLGEIEKGRQHTIDQVDVLLKTHAEVLQEDPEPETLNIEAIVEQVQAAPEPEPTPEPVPEPEPTPEPEVELVAEASEPEHTEVPKAEPDRIKPIFRSATKRLALLGDHLRTSDVAETKIMLDQTAEALTWIGEHLEEADLPGDAPEVAQARAMTENASDLVQLLRMEAPEDAGIEAIKAMLQLKRGFQAALAA